MACARVGGLSPAGVCSLPTGAACIWLDSKLCHLTFCIRFTRPLCATEPADHAYYAPPHPAPLLEPRSLLASTHHAATMQLLNRSTVGVRPGMGRSQRMAPAARPRFGAAQSVRDTGRTAERARPRARRAPRRARLRPLSNASPPSRQLSPAPTPPRRAATPAATLLPPAPPPHTHPKAVVPRAGPAALSTTVAKETFETTSRDAYFTRRHELVLRHFPTALGVDDFISRAEIALSAHGFRGDNSIGGWPHAPCMRLHGIACACGGFSRSRAGARRLVVGGGWFSGGKAAAAREAAAPRPKRGV
jgi:hypothetical protein